MLPLESNFLVPNGTFLVVAARVRDPGLDLREVPHPADQQGDDRAPGGDPHASSPSSTRPRPRRRKAEADYKEQLNNAKHEAARIREEAREQGAQIVQEAREKAQTEADRIIEHAHTQIEADRKAAMASLRRDVGSLATDAGRPHRG